MSNVSRQNFHMITEFLAKRFTENCHAMRCQVCSFYGHIWPMSSGNKQFKSERLLVPLETGQDAHDRIQILMEQQQ
jgi:hypothetical protein